MTMTQFRTAKDQPFFVPGPEQLSPSLDGRAIVFRPDDALLAAASRSLDIGREARNAMLSEARKIHADDYESAPRRHVLACAAVDKFGEPGFAAIEARARAIANEIEKYEKLLTAPPPPSDPESEKRAEEIRASVRAMTGTQRAAALSAAVTDPEAAAALLNGHFLAAGLTAGELEILRAKWRSAARKDEAQRRNELLKAKRALDLGLKLLREAHGRCFLPNVVEEAKAIERARRRS